MTPPAQPSGVSRKARPTPLTPAGGQWSGNGILNHEVGCRWIGFLFTNRGLAEVTRRSARPASPARLYRAQWGSNRVETVFLRKPTDRRNAGLSRNYSNLGGFQQFRTERQKPIPANSIGFLRKEKTRVFCEAAAPRKTACQKGPKGSPVGFCVGA
jgi:hypothetical protein